MISRHFKVEELFDKETVQIYGADAWLFIPDESVMMVDGVRDFFGAPVTVNNWLWGGNFQYRGYRPLTCKIGAKNSYHRKCRAFDFDVKGLTAQDARNAILSNKDDERLSFITRMEADVNWVHIDNGPVPAGKERIYLFKG